MTCRTNTNCINSIPQYIYICSEIVIIHFTMTSCSIYKKKTVILMGYQKTRVFNIVGKLLHRHNMLLNHTNWSCSREKLALVFSYKPPAFLVDVAVLPWTSILFYIIYLHRLTRRRMLEWWRGGVSYMNFLLYNFNGALLPPSVTD